MTAGEPHLEVRRVDHHDEEWIRGRMRTRWGDESVACHGRLYDPAALPGFVVVADLIEPVGLVTYSLEDEQCEVVTIDSMREGIGVGSLLLDAVIRLPWAPLRPRRDWLITTNDNVPAQAWYERRGFRGSPCTRAP